MGEFLITPLFLKSLVWFGESFTDLKHRFQEKKKKVSPNLFPLSPRQRPASKPNIPGKKEGPLPPVLSKPKIQITQPKEKKAETPDLKDEDAPIMGEYRLPTLDWIISPFN